MNLAQLKSFFLAAGTRELYAKPLAENDNSKNQVYFGPGFKTLNLLPIQDIVPESSLKNPIFKAKLDFAWLTPDGTAVTAPRAQLILYPQYPEVRFSGFLQGCSVAPSSLMASRLSGRILFLGVTSDRKVLGFVVPAESEIAREYRSLIPPDPNGVFFRLALPRVPSEPESTIRLLDALGRIHRAGWIDAKQLNASGRLKPCSAPQCGGFTLEAELGIPKNSLAEPDFLGWEVKQHAVSRFAPNCWGGAITLMTPEPTGGFYKEHGVEAFVRKFGYPDVAARPDRYNFGGLHRIGERNARTGLRMELLGYNVNQGKIEDVKGAIVLLSDQDLIVAEWAFSGLLAHWARKHAKAVYVPSMSRQTDSKRQYCYGNHLRLARRTDSLRLLAALASRSVYYDPGIKLEDASTPKPKTKRRSQFRIASKTIGVLYEELEMVTV